MSREFGNKLDLQEGRCLVSYSEQVLIRRTANHWTKEKEELLKLLLSITLDVQYQYGAGDSLPAYTFHSPTLFFNDKLSFKPL